MNGTDYSASAARTELLRPILIGGGIAGALDKIWGFIAFGLKSPQAIAAGLI